MGPHAQMPDGASVMSCTVAVRSLQSKVSRAKPRRMKNDRLLVWALLCIAIGWFLCSLSKRVESAQGGVLVLDSRLAALEAEKEVRERRWGWFRRVVARLPILRLLVS